MNLDLMSDELQFIFYPQHGRDPYLLSLELSVYSTVTILLTTGAASFTNSGLQIGMPSILVPYNSNEGNGLSIAVAAKGWTHCTAIHIITQALGGILVGQVQNIFSI